MSVPECSSEISSYSYSNEGVSKTKYPVNVASQKFIRRLMREDVSKIDIASSKTFDHYRVHLKDGSFISVSKHHYGKPLDPNPLIWCFHFVHIGKNRTVGTPLKPKYLKLIKKWDLELNIHNKKIFQPAPFEAPYL